MIKQIICALVVLTVVVAVYWNRLDREKILKSHQEAKTIGMLIWKNECGGKKEGLTSWNEGEEFGSFGIGHFIWYPEGETIIFKEGFPKFIQYAHQQTIAMPQWLREAKTCPWENRKKFLEDFQQPQMVELREWLFVNVDIQIEYIISRLSSTLPLLLKHTTPEETDHILFQFNRILDSPGGKYALIDYLNFKGEGIKTTERYNGYGWGLIQVLSRMKGKKNDFEAIQEFVDSAKTVLELRIMHSPPERKEERWKKGWFNRLDTYVKYARSNFLDL